MTSMTETYLWSAIFVMGGFLSMIYFWLMPMINAKVKYFFTGGQGTLDISPDGKITLKVQNTNHNDCVDIRGREKPINPNYKQFKFCGIPCHLFVPSVPTNIDLLFKKKDLTKTQLKLIERVNTELKIPLQVFEGRFNYDGIPDRDVDNHIANMTKDPLREIWIKYKNILIYVLLGIFAAVVILAMIMYKDHQILKTCGSLGTDLINVVAPN